MKFRPLGDRVVVKRVQEDVKTAGGIIIPDTAQEKPQEGEIVAVGPGGENGLFVPFTDATSGRETYGGGRYLDLPERADGTYVLDFNAAYHPYCVYDPAYSCPVPPPENRLALAVTAGERLPSQTAAGASAAP